MRRVRLTRAARSDIAGILRWSEEQFGATARARYKSLLDQSLRDLAEDLGRPGVRRIEDIRRGYFTYHIKWAKARTEAPTVKQPRHLLVFALDGQTVVVAAVVHERELLPRHLGRRSV